MVFLFVWSAIDIEKLHAEDAQFLPLVQLRGRRQTVVLADVLPPLPSELEDGLVGDGPRELIDVEVLQTKRTLFALLQPLEDAGLKYGIIIDASAHGEGGVEMLINKATATEKERESKERKMTASLAGVTRSSESSFKPVRRC